MKRIIFILALACYSPFMVAQDLGDAVRYSSDQLNGTARYISMGGAFDALGGDMSAIGINPAGSAVFLTNQISFSLDVMGYKNDVDFGDGHNSYRNNIFSLNQGGVVFVFNNSEEDATVTRLTFGVNYSRDNSYKNRWTAIGRSDETISDMFLDYAQGMEIGFLTPQNGQTLTDKYSDLGSTADIRPPGSTNEKMQTAYLGYEGFLFDALDDSDEGNTAYTSNVSGNSFDHVYHHYERGLNGKLSFNAALAIQDRFYLGLNLNSHFLDYSRTTIMNEYIPDPSEINEINFLNYLQTKANGFSLQVGGIARISDMFRVSLAYDSPVWYNVYNEETNQILRTDSNLYGEAYVDPAVTNVYGDYRFRTPGKVSVGAAAVFGKSAILSAGYSYQDYSNIKYTSGGFNYLNNMIDHNLQAVSSYHVGGEYRIKNLSLRAGFRYEDSPYKDEKIVGDLKGYSAGIGYDFGGFKLDFAYDLAQRDYENPLLNTGFSERADVKNKLSHYVLTFVFPF